MILRDGRGEVHDLGARHVFTVSDLKMAAGYGENPTGRWGNDMSFLFARLERPVREPRPKVVYEDRTSAERQRRYRELHRAEVNARSASRRRIARAAARVAA